MIGMALTSEKVVHWLEVRTLSFTKLGLDEDQAIRAVATRYDLDELKVKSLLEAIGA